MLNGGGTGQPGAEPADLRPFGRALATEVALARERWTRPADPDDVPQSPSLFLGMASMYLGRAVYAAIQGDQLETKSAVIKAAAMLYEAWRLVEHPPS